jgi:hypothetical protein
LREFAECLQETLRAEQPAAAEAATGPQPTPPPPAARPAKPVSGLSVFFGALWDRLRRLFRR